MNTQKHWDDAYNGKSTELLGWYEKNPQPSLNLIRKLNLSRYAEIINVGSGTSTLIQELLEDGFQNITINDISPVALAQLREILGKEECNVEWMQDDLTQPTALKTLPMIDLWHDRAVLHFFTSPEDQLTYFNLIRQKVKPGGTVIIGVFKEGGATHCCGLPVVQYNEEMMAERLGSEFLHQETLEYTFVNPYGAEKPYIYTVFQRKQA